MNSVIAEMTDESGQLQPLFRRPGALRCSLVILLLIAAAVLVRLHVPPWIFMWFLAAAIFFFCKWLMWGRAVLGRHVALPTRLIFFLGWVGMDPQPFLDGIPRGSNRFASNSIAKDMAGTFFRLGLGVMLFVVALRGFPAPAIARGWVAMSGIVLILHFGIFDLFAWFWRSRGFPVEPLMRKPLRSGSVSEFWSRRWNTAFNHIALTLAFRPLSRRFGASRGIIGVFFLSGLIHELVISLPAGGGYGLPTAYFVLQGLGILLERRLFRGTRRCSPVNKRAGEMAVLKRVFTILVVAGPALILFHLPFIHNLILPMLRAFGGK